jgi:hypothetical protein
MPASDKEIIAQLVKIAQKQQLIINKLAQELHPTTPQNSPQPAHPVLDEVGQMLSSTEPHFPANFQPTYNQQIR